MLRTWIFLAILSGIAYSLWLNSGDPFPQPNLSTGRIYPLPDSPGFMTAEEAGWDSLNFVISIPLGICWAVLLLGIRGLFRGLMIPAWGVVPRYDWRIGLATACGFTLFVWRIGPRLVEWTISSGLVDHLHPRGPL